MPSPSSEPNLHCGGPFVGRMIVLAALMLQAGGDPPYPGPLTRVIQYLARRPNDNGPWGEPPPACCCPASTPGELRIPIVPDDETIRCFDYLQEILPSDLPSERGRAEKGLFRLGLPVVPLLQESRTHSDPEVAGRCREALRDLWRRNPFVRTAFGDPWTEDFELQAT